MRRAIDLRPSAVAAALLLAVTAAPAALGQTVSRDDFIATPAAGVWSANDMIGLTVHGADGVELGPVVDVLVGGAGEDGFVVFETGGFLGSGEKRIAAPLRSFNIVAEAQGEEARSAGSAAVGTQLPPQNAQQGPDAAGGPAAAGLKPLYLELAASQEDLATAPPFSTDPKRIPAVAP